MGDCPASSLPLASAYPWAKEPANTIEWFGRFPHRNAVLGLTATDQESECLTVRGFTG
ncbi:DUF924 family protein [Pseudomonas antarctica]|uniref:DUF924 family protein n=1 Tax=Pseudomonas antarctica TaxID=219572 RepID=UPI0039C167F1